MSFLDSLYKVPEAPKQKPSAAPVRPAAPPPVRAQPVQRPIQPPAQPNSAGGLLDQLYGPDVVQQADQMRMANKARNKAAKSKIEENAIKVLTSPPVVRGVGFLDSLGFGLVRTAAASAQALDFTEGSWSKKFAAAGDEWRRGLRAQAAGLTLGGAEHLIGKTEPFVFGQELTQRSAAKYKESGKEVPALIRSEAGQFWTGLAVDVLAGPQTIGALGRFVGAVGHNTGAVKTIIGEVPSAAKMLGRTNFDGKAQGITALVQRLESKGPTLRDVTPFSGRLEASNTRLGKAIKGSGVLDQTLTRAVSASAQISTSATPFANLWNGLPEQTRNFLARSAWDRLNRNIGDARGGQVGQALSGGAQKQQTGLRVMNDWFRNAEGLGINETSMADFLIPGPLKEKIAPGQYGEVNRGMASLLFELRATDRYARAIENDAATRFGQLYTRMPNKTAADELNTIFTRLLDAQPDAGDQLLGTTQRSVSRSALDELGIVRRGRKKADGTWEPMPLLSQTDREVPASRNLEIGAPRSASLNPLNLRNLTPDRRTPFALGLRHPDGFIKKIAEQGEASFRYTDELTGPSFPERHGLDVETFREEARAALGSMIRARNELGLINLSQGQYSPKGFLQSMNIDGGTRMGISQAYAATEAPEAWIKRVLERNDFPEVSRVEVNRDKLTATLVSSIDNAKLNYRQSMLPGAPLADTDIARIRVAADPSLMHSLGAALGDKAFVTRVQDQLLDMAGPNSTGHGMSVDSVKNAFNEQGAYMALMAHKPQGMDTSEYITKLSEAMTHPAILKRESQLMKAERMYSARLQEAPQEFANKIGQARQYLREMRGERNVATNAAFTEGRLFPGDPNYNPATDALNGNTPDGGGNPNAWAFLPGDAATITARLQNEGYVKLHPSQYDGADGVFVPGMTPESAAQLGRTMGVEDVLTEQGFISLGDDGNLTLQRLKDLKAGEQAAVSTPDPLNPIRSAIDANDAVATREALEAALDSGAISDRKLRTPFRNDTFDDDLTLEDFARAAGDEDEVWFDGLKEHLDQMGDSAPSAFEPRLAAIHADPSVENMQALADEMGEASYDSYPTRFMGDISVQDILESGTPDLFLRELDEIMRHFPDGTRPGSGTLKIGDRKYHFGGVGEEENLGSLFDQGKSKFTPQSPSNLKPANDFLTRADMREMVPVLREILKRPDLGDLAPLKEGIELRDEVHHWIGQGGMDLSRYMGDERGGIVDSIAHVRSGNVGYATFDMRLFDPDTGPGEFIDLLQRDPKLRVGEAVDDFGQPELVVASDDVIRKGLLRHADAEGQALAEGFIRAYEDEGITGLFREINAAQREAATWPESNQALYRLMGSPEPRDAAKGYTPGEYHTINRNLRVYDAEHGQFVKKVQLYQEMLDDSRPGVKGIRKFAIGGKNYEYRDGSLYSSDPPNFKNARPQEHSSPVFMKKSDADELARITKDNPNARVAVANGKLIVAENPESVMLKRGDDIDSLVKEFPIKTEGGAMGDTLVTFGFPTNRFLQNSENMELTGLMAERAGVKRVYMTTDVHGEVGPQNAANNILNDFSVIRAPDSLASMPYTYKRLDFEAGDLGDRYFYHGGIVPEENLLSGDTARIPFSPESLYHKGLYSTDKPKLAHEYTQNKNSGPDARIYRFKIGKNVKIMDLDKDATPERVALMERAFNRAVNEIGDGTKHDFAGEIQDAIILNRQNNFNIIDEDAPFTMAEYTVAYRQWANNRLAWISDMDPEEIPHLGMNILNDEFQADGWGGVAHMSGVVTGNDASNVVILFGDLTSRGKQQGLYAPDGTLMQTLEEPRPRLAETEAQKLRRQPLRPFLPAPTSAIPGPTDFTITPDMARAMTGDIADFLEANPRNRMQQLIEPLQQKYGVRGEEVAALFNELGERFRPGEYGYRRYLNKADARLEAEEFLSGINAGRPGKQGLQHGIPEVKARDRYISEEFQEMAGVIKDVRARMQINRGVTRAATATRFMSGLRELAEEHDMVFTVKKSFDYDGEFAALKDKFAPALSRLTKKRGDKVDEADIRAMSPGQMKDLIEQNGLRGASKRLDAHLWRTRRGDELPAWETRPHSWTRVDSSVEKASNGIFKEGEYVKDYIWRHLSISSRLTGDMQTVFMEGTTSFFKRNAIASIPAALRQIPQNLMAYVENGGDLILLAQGMMEYARVGAGQARKQGIGKTVGKALAPRKEKGWDELTPEQREIYMNGIDDSGLVSDVRRAGIEALAREIKTGKADLNGFMQGMSKAGKVWFYARDKSLDIFQMTDDMFRGAIYFGYKKKFKNAMKSEGLGDEQADVAAQRMATDFARDVLYSATARPLLVDFLDRTGIYPFMGYASWSTWKFMENMYMRPQFTHNVTIGLEENRRFRDQDPAASTLEGTWPKFVHTRLPVFLGKTNENGKDKYYFFDAAPLLPAGQLLSMAEHGREGLNVGPLESLSTPGGPIVQGLYGALISGQDPFGRSIYGGERTLREAATSDPTEAAWRLSAHVLSQFNPPWAAGKSLSGKLGDAISQAAYAVDEGQATNIIDHSIAYLNGIPVPFSGGDRLPDYLRSGPLTFSGYSDVNAGTPHGKIPQPLPTGMTALAGYLGVNVTAYDPQASAMSQARTGKFEVQDARQEIKRRIQQRAQFLASQGKKDQIRNDPDILRWTGMLMDNPGIIKGRTKIETGVRAGETIEKTK